MKLKKRILLDCGDLAAHDCAWAYQSLVHVRDLVDTMDKWALANENFTETLVERRLVGSAVVISCFLNILEDLHGPRECDSEVDGCVIAWTRDFLDNYRIPDLND